MKGWLFGWTAAVVAAVCILALAADLAKRRTHHSADAALKTLSAAQAAGADAIPTNPKRTTAAR